MSLTVAAPLLVVVLAAVAVALRARLGRPITVPLWAAIAAAALAFVRIAQ